MAATAAIRDAPAEAPGLPLLRRPGVRGALLAAPAVLALTALFVVPLGIFTVYALLKGSYYEVSGQLTLGNFTDALSSPTVRRLAFNALFVGVLTGAICLVLSLPLAFFLRYRAGRFEFPLLMVLVLAMFSSYLVRLYAWRTVLGDGGLVQQLLDPIGLGSIGSSLLFTRAAVIVAMVHIFVPYVTLVSYAAMRNLPRDYIDLASDLGAGAVSRWRRLLLPMLAPAVTAGFLYTLVLSASDYVAPQYLGGRDGNMVGLLIQKQFTEAGNYPSGAAMSLLMLAVFLMFYAALTLLLRALKLTNLTIKT